METVNVRVEFTEEMAHKFKAVKEHLGVENNTEVLRILLNKEYSRITKKEAKP